MKCKDCKYWEAYADDEMDVWGHSLKGWGYCHRYPSFFLQPHNAEMAGQLIGETQDSNWCGEFEVKL